MHKKIIAISMFAALAAGMAHATVLQNGVLAVGVDDGGAIIDQTAGLGLAYDRSGHGDYSKDILWPGTAFGFASIGVGSAFDTAGGEFNMGGNPFNFATTASTATSLSQSGSYNGLDLLQSVSLSGNTVHFSITFSNHSGAGISNVAYATGSDPDPDYYAPGGEFSSFNSQTGSGSGTAAGVLSGITLSLADASNGNVHGLISSSYPWSVDPYGLSGNPSANWGNTEGALALGYNLGTLADGQSITLAYDYSVTAVPEPETWALTGMGLVGLVAGRKRLLQRGLRRIG